MSALQCALMPWRAARRIREQREGMDVLIRVAASLVRQIPENERPGHLMLVHGGKDAS